jgi:hypothetical protein
LISDRRDRQQCRPAPISAAKHQKSTEESKAAARHHDLIRPAYTCANVHALIAANRFVFIGTPIFQDFVVADVYYCGSSQYVQLRSVPASDNPECIVNFCISRPDRVR